MEMFLGFMVLLACLFLGIKHGGIGLAVISGIGLMAYTFLFGYSRQPAYRRYADNHGSCYLRRLPADIRRSDRHAEVCGTLPQK